MAQPSEEDIDQIVAFTDFTDRALIALALKAKNNNLDQVVNEIFDNRTKFISTYGWDDKAFSSPREGTPNSVPSFAIHAADDRQVLQGVDPGYYQGQIGAPSRPPSRTNNRSPLSRLVDLTADNNTGNALPPTSLEQEDADLQQAIAASVATSNIQSPQPQAQESGVVDADTGLPHFGPANRPEYNQNEWAMVTLNHDKPEPEPSQRKRKPNVPAFLRCRSENSWETHRLGAIITILHAIPGGRNSLLRYGAPPPQGYGSNPEWWKGKAIVLPGVQATQDAGEVTWGDESKPGWSEELHRLMSFLDATERSYGTADVLADTAPEGQQPSTDSERDFYDYICGSDNAENAKTFVSTCQLMNVVDPEADLNHVSRFATIDFIYKKEQLAMAESLYSLLDMTFLMDYKTWVGDTSTAQCALITELADVMTMRFTGDDGLPKPIEVPQRIYLDRYLAVNRGQITDIQRKLHILAKALVRAEKAEKRVTMLVDPTTSKEVNRLELNRAAIAQIRRERALVKQWAIWRMHQEEKDRTGVEPETLLPSDTPDDAIEWTGDEAKSVRFLEAKVLQLEDELARVEDEVADIHRDRDMVITAHRELEQRMTREDEKLEISPRHAYSLRGVSSSVDTFYVCVRAEPDLMELDEELSDGSLDQWWKLGYVANAEESIKAEMVTYDKVMEEACGVGSKPILIFASEKALDESPSPLSDALQTFIRFDNHLFKKELTEEVPRNPKRGGFTSPASPSKRRNRSNSVDSMATNAASAGDFDDDMRDAPFEADDPFLLGDGAEALPDLIDLGETPAPVHPFYDPAAPGQSVSDPPESNRYGDVPIGLETATSSPGTSVRQMANVSLDEMVSRANEIIPSPPLAVPFPRNAFPVAPTSTDQQQQVAEETKGPEMQERGGATSPFLLKKTVSRGAESTMDMELDEKAHEGAADEDH